MKVELQEKNLKCTKNQNGKTLPVAQTNQKKKQNKTKQKKKQQNSMSYVQTQRQNNDM